MELIFALLIALKDPYAWEMDCDRWRTRAVEIYQDENIPIEDRKFLIRYLRSKVKGECPFDWTQVGH